MQRMYSSHEKLYINQNADNLNIVGIPMYS